MDFTQLDQRLAQNAQSLHIKRLPPRIKREFVAWANQEFSGEDGKGDYGMALKWLWEGRLDATLLHQRIAELEARLNKLETPAPAPERTRRMLDGKTTLPKRE